MKKHPRTIRHCCFDSYDNNLKAILNATFFCPHQESSALGFSLVPKFAQPYIAEVYYLCTACHGISLGLFLYHIIFSFYLQNVYVSAIWSDKNPYFDLFLIYVYFCVSFWFLWIQICVFYVIQIFNQNSSKWIIILHLNFFFVIFSIFPIRKSQIQYFSGSHFCEVRDLLLKGLLYS